MYLIVFWDHIPTMVAHKYYCDKYAGLTVNKTVEQWNQENPGVATPAMQSNPVELVDKTVRFNLNEFIVYDTKDKSEMLGILRHTSELKDTRDNLIIAKHVDFSTDIMNISLGARGLRDYKLWLLRNSCEAEDNMQNWSAFKQFKRTFQDMGR